MIADTAMLIKYLPLNLRILTEISSQNYTFLEKNKKMTKNVFEHEFPGIDHELKKFEMQITKPIKIFDKQENPLPPLLDHCFYILGINQAL